MDRLLVNNLEDNDSDSITRNILELEKEAKAKLNELRRINKSIVFEEKRYLESLEDFTIKAPLIFIDRPRNIVYISKEESLANSYMFRNLFTGLVIFYSALDIFFDTSKDKID